MLHRRDLLLGSLPGFLTYALLAEAGIAIAASSRLPAARWISRQEELARGLRTGTVSQREWHTAVNALAREVDLESIAAELRRATAMLAGEPFGHDPQKRTIRFLDESGVPARLSYGVATFSFEADNVITPHAHRYMASAHMVVEGEVRVRTFDRVGERDGVLVIRPTRDEVARAGDAAAMTTAADNVHWFVPKSAHATTLDVIIDGLEAGPERYLIQPVDPLAGKHLADGTIEAPILSFEESMRRYSAQM